MSVTSYPNILISFSFMGISQSLPMTGYIKMIDIWMIFTMSYPFVVISLHCFQRMSVRKETMKINVDKFALLWREAQLCFPYV